MGRSRSSCVLPRLRIRVPFWVVDGSTSIVGATFDETKEEKGFGKNEGEFDVHEAWLKEGDSALVARGGVRGSAGDIAQSSGDAEEIISSHMERSCADRQISLEYEKLCMHTSVAVFQNIGDSERI